jgi:hypothetical protein
MVANVLYVPATKIANLYFRLNGFLGVEYFVLHPQDRNHSQRTDADFYGVRFQYHTELNMEDDAPFKNGRKSPLFVIAEITRVLASLMVRGPIRPTRTCNMFSIPSARSIPAKSMQSFNRFLGPAHIQSQEQIRNV